MATAQVLDERVPADHDARRPVGLQSPHRPQAGFEPAVVGLAAVVLILAGVVERRRNQLVDHVRQRRSPIGDDLHWGARRERR